MTLRQLDRMARGRMQADWLRTGSLLAMLANVNRDAKQRRKPYQITDFIPPDLVPPAARHKRPKESADKVKLLETIFPKK